MGSAGKRLLYGEKTYYMENKGVCIFSGNGKNGLSPVNVILGCGGVSFEESNLGNFEEN